MIDPTLGYWLGDSAAIHGLSTLAWNCEITATARLQDPAWLKQMREECQKPFYVNVLSGARDPLVAPIMEFARSPRMLEILRAYYQSNVIDLSHIGVFASGYAPWSFWRKPLRGTQIPHFDVGDPKHVKLFCMLTDVGPSDGPLTLWSAAVSEPYNVGKARVEEIKLNGLQGVKLTGPKGTTALVDTSRCIHYGSRTQGGKRLALVIHYCTDARRYSTVPSERYADLNVVGL